MFLYNNYTKSNQQNSNSHTDFFFVLKSEIASKFNNKFQITNNKHIIRKCVIFEKRRKKNFAVF